MRKLGVIVFLTLCFHSSFAAEFDARLSLQGDGYLNLSAPFFADPDGDLGLAASNENYAFRFKLNSSGTVRRTQLSLKNRNARVENYAIGDDLIEFVSPIDFGFPIFPNYGELRRYSANGTLDYVRSFSGGFPTAPAIKADGLGGFWFATLGLMHVDRQGNITRISRTQNRGKSLIVGNHLLEYQTNSIFRTPLSVTPVAHQTTPLPENRSLSCIVANVDQSLFGLAVSFESSVGRYFVHRLTLSEAGFVQSSEILLRELTRAPEIRCAPNRAAILALIDSNANARQLIMLDRNLSIQWGAVLPASEFYQILAMGPGGEALMIDRTSGNFPVKRFSAQGRLTELPNIGIVRAAYDADSSLYFTRRQEVVNGAYLQVSQYKSDNLSLVPTLVYDLRAPIGAPIALAAAIENGAVELLSKNPEVSHTQHIRIDADGKSQVQYERTDPISNVQRFSNGWLTQTKNPDGAPQLQLNRDSGSLIFNVRLLADLLACEALLCDFSSAGGTGQIDQTGRLSALSPLLISGTALNSAPQQRASIFNENRIIRLLGNRFVYGPALFRADAQVAQNSDGTHWLVDAASATFADFLGVPLTITPCPTGLACRLMLDKKAKRVFAIYGFFQEPGQEIREVGRNGLIAPAWRLDLPLGSAYLNATTLTSSGELVWIRGNAQTTKGETSEFLLAIDITSGLQQFWTLDSSTVQSSGLRGDSLQFANADRSLISIEKVNEGSRPQLSVRRFEFRPNEPAFANGFE